ncbi:uncharacterized protein [Physcomitrium patens]|uniref:TNFR-Cys domain-containing protein n=1 Tax=Physcomitrium patens TaxID=3218 RepID=A0A2K1J9Q9_PHYPA|nr:keratin-associated protein 5-2-like [Physcomitrium patens]PNR38263.1 hypothetical protein PHYPA_021374 [Physcomitrium patens]|eukprot:XP_024398285.1 keratin-associated protein 5-2-like [Physcomitrella patens]
MAVSHSAFVVLAFLVICSVCTRNVDAGCPSGYKDCGYSRGCKSAVKSDVKNCGNCGVKCHSPSNATPVCSNGVCGYRCKQYFKDCDKRKDNGCEVAIRTDVKNCGRCGKVCPQFKNAVSQCREGRCTSKCMPGYSDCNNDMVKDGCETFVMGSDGDNCGKCGSKCAFNQYPFGVYGCTAGKCQLIQCYRGMTDCNGNITDGCETNTYSDLNNCNGCGSVCAARPHSSPICVNSLGCYFICDEGWSNCNRPWEECRVDIYNDVNNCGECYNTCPTGYSCKKGVCTQ